MDTTSGGPDLPGRTEMARRFGLLLERFPRADGDPWRGREMEEATDGEITTSYFSALRAGKFCRPGAHHLDLIADAMGFPPVLFRLDPVLWDEVAGGRPPAPLAEVLELGECERKMVAVMRSLDARRQEAVLAIARQVAAC